MRLLAAMTAAVLGLHAPGAHAASDSTIVGGCSFASLSDPVVGPGQQTGEIDVEAVVYSPTAASNPVWATITCYIKVNGVPQPGAVITASGVVAVVGGGLITYPSTESDFVQLCQRVDYTGPGDATPTSDVCFDQVVIILPPVVCEADCGLGTLICTATAAAPDVPGIVDTNEQGDVYLAGEPFWGCPPYDIEWE